MIKRIYGEMVVGHWVSQKFEMSKGDYVPNILTISKLLVSSRLKIAWITDVKIKASSAYGTFGKTGMLFFLGHGNH